MNGKIHAPARRIKRHQAISKNRRIIVLRNSPNWEINAKIWQEKQELVPKLFLPNPLPSGFPLNTVDLIRLWNETFKIDFFSIRSLIKKIASKRFIEMRPDHIITQVEFEANPLNWTKDSLIFFSDDDDFACADLFDRVEPHMAGNVQCVRWSSISIGKRLENRIVVNRLPRARHWIHGQTILRPAKLGFIKPYIDSKKHIVGIHNELTTLPLLTNNYVMKISDLSGLDALKYVDHVNASHNLWRSSIKVVSLEDDHFSFTIKHPSSITAFNNIVNNNFEKEFLIQKMANYINDFSRNEFPSKICWMSETFLDVLDVYKAVLP